MNATMIAALAMDIYTIVGLKGALIDYGKFGTHCYALDRKPGEVPDRKGYQRTEVFREYETKDVLFVRYYPCPEFEPCSKKDDETDSPDGKCAMCKNQCIYEGKRYARYEKFRSRDNSTICTCNRDTKVSFDKKNKQKPNISLLCR